MPNEKSWNVPRADLLGRLARAVEAGADPELPLAELGVASEDRECVLSRAKELLRRARARVPPAEATETQLALGVLLALSRSPSAQAGK